MDESQEPGLGLDVAAPRPVPGAEQYRVLARKYRPQNFTGLIGQDALVRTLRNAFSSGRIAHAFMLTGVRGVGKTTTARIIARALNCIGPDGKRTQPSVDPCGKCEPCRAIAESRFVDVQEMDAASRTGIDDIREIIEATRYGPAGARYKIYIIDEVHMLSKSAFNGLLKTLEEPPPRVKFIFATTEIRKVPVTVLSRCQRFDLRRINTGMLVNHLQGIAKTEAIAVQPAALQMIARAAEGSVRDALSLLDQAIAHQSDENSTDIEAATVRNMLGLADRGRIFDLFEKLVSGDIAGALGEFRALYADGADPLAVMQDLLETTHFLTRVKVAPGADGFFDGGSAEAARAVVLAGKLAVPQLTRCWQMLLKGLIEVRDAASPAPAAEMALIRLAYAADLPSTELLVRKLRDEHAAAPASASAPSAARPRDASPPPTMPPPRASGAAVAPAAMPSAPPVKMEAPGEDIRTLEEMVRIARARGDRILAACLETNVHLVALEPGRIVFRPNPQAPKNLAHDLSRQLQQWTGRRWIVTVAAEGGAPTLAESRLATERARKDAAAQEPFVRAVLDAFPGAEIISVREQEGFEPGPVSDEESNS
ncbi:MAG TPA: DNA polymerase III subunit gamma/tau [Micropepsaceae bacterium]|nr:DNA polymerase III subunit gamma/tau [Micropepsaceae bacterium]